MGTAGWTLDGLPGCCSRTARRAPSRLRAAQCRLSRVLGVGVLGMGLLGLACMAPPDPATSESPLLPEPPSLEVEFSGCERVLAGPVCELKPGQPLWLWQHESFRGLELRADALVQSGEERAVAGGYQLAVAPPSGARALSLWQNGQRRWSLALAPHRASPRLALIQAARERGDAAFIEQQIAAARREGATLEAVLGEGVLARVWLRQGRASEAAALLESTAGMLFGLGQLSEGSRDVFARLFVLLQRNHALADARAWLARWRDEVAKYPLGRALVADHEGMLKATLGEPVPALLAYREAERLYERIGEQAHARRVRQEQVGLLSDVGQPETALVLLGSLLPPLPDEAVCTTAQLFILQAWLTLLSAEEGATERERELPAAFAASEPWEQRCGDPEVVVTGLVNRGLWALDTGDRELGQRVESALAALPARRSPELGAWVLELRARFALERGQRHEARQLFELEGLIGKSSGRLDPELRALLGLAAVADAQGASAHADALLGEARAALARAQRWGAFGSLVYGQFASRQRAARELVLRLIGRGELNTAWDVALSAYRAALAVQARGSEQAAWPAAARERWDARIGAYRQARERLDRAAENDWQLSSAELRVAEAQRHDERQDLEQLLQQAARERPDASGAERLPRPAADEYWWLVFPAETRAGREYVALGTDGIETLAARVPARLLPPETTSGSDHPLLAPFAAPLARATSIVLLPAGRARTLELESFRLAGQPLSKHRLAFGAALGALPGVSASPTPTALPKPSPTATLPSAAPARAPAPLPRRASVSADPRGDLPFSRREGELVASLLKIPDSRSASGAQVTGSRLLEQLETSDFFHFAGHALASGATQEAALLLANGDELQPWELFSLRSVPREVVLSACEAGEGSASGFGVGWGLAQALLALGSETVIAPVRRVDDAQAYALQRRLYAGLESGLTLRDAFWSAQLGENDPSFRLFTR